MKAFVLNSLGSTPTVEEIDMPIVQTLGEIRVRVIAAGLNPVDVLTVAGSADRGPHPRVLGLEGVVSFNDRPFYIERAVLPHGTLAEWTIVQESGLIALPEDLDPTGAVPLGIAGLAGWVPMATTAALQPGETVIVLGATGAVGQAAVQAAKHLGAGRVVAVGRNKELLNRLLDRGADAVVVLGSGDDAAAIKEASSGGADVILDALYGAPLVAALKSARPGARSITVGSQAGAMANIPLMSLFGSTLHSYSNMTATTADKADAFATMARLTAAGEFVIEHEVVAFDDISEIWKRQIEGPGAKYVVAI